MSVARRLSTAVAGLAIAAALGFATARAAELDTELASPEPDFDNPRRIMLQLSTDDERAVNNILWNAINLQKFYGPDSVEIAVIVFGPGMKAVYAGSSPVGDRVRSQLKYGIRFIGCGNTLEATHRSPDELIEGVDYVESAIAEIVERRLAGWVYVRP